MAKTFRINDKITIECNSESAGRSGFRHRAKLFFNGQQVDETTMHYQNRTWEAYEFQSVMQKLIDKTDMLLPQETALCKSFVNKDNTDWSGMKMTGMIAGLGDIFAKKTEEKNAWKTRMLKAGLGNQGLEIPSDWDELNPKVKEARLNKVINLTKNVGKKNHLKNMIAKETGSWG